MFTQQRSKQLKEEMPNANIKELNARIVEEYKKMSDAEKAKL